MKKLINVLLLAFLIFPNLGLADDGAPYFPWFVRDPLLKKNIDGLWYSPRVNKYFEIRTDHEVDFDFSMIKNIDVFILEKSSYCFQEVYHKSVQLRPFTKAFSINFEDQTFAFGFVKTNNQFNNLPQKTTQFAIMSMKGLSRRQSKRDMHELKVTFANNGDLLQKIDTVTGITDCVSE